ncbi:NAD(P)/FAD-dependent oxidoreductase [Larsenimonas rhizosphaerae]|uniref:FAD/NAD(P)-binding oxidoreductase n=1 Tax=Larsenimonas rhizosphaerae TaxID=2944682 RepID=A0AA41ZJG7_9GAMM|nr:FAD/NAD(P)-binding oxidoreductase [Larsenimonas rhizosphaerae]MCX2525389.1 FAD/NAD(P)-binding oxidoreductase [Larsenimonas rhizosphaerae]
MSGMNDLNQEASAHITGHDVVIIGGGAGGIAVAASLHRREPALDIAIVEPATEHFYQPGWTLVGGGVFTPEQTRRTMASVMPSFVTWHRCAATALLPDQHQVELDSGATLRYRALVVAPGLTLDWSAIEGLDAALGHHGVTSNYRADLAPYTWSLTQSMTRGRALFTQPPMPIKCAGAPQKAMYLSCAEWERKGVLGDIDVNFHNAGGALFGVAAFVPALERYIRRYGIQCRFQQTLIAVDGPARLARFQVTSEAGNDVAEVPFDMLHVVPPQRAPELVRTSVLANDAGWLDLTPETLQHTRFEDVFGLGDASGTSNAKTAAAVRKQAPVVADNLVAQLKGDPLPSCYRGYGACPLTVERGRVVLAEFGYGGELQPTFPDWVNQARQATRLGWHIKARQLPFIYWNLMLKGHEWLAGPDRRA